MNKETTAEFYFNDEDYNYSEAGSSENMIHFGEVKIKNIDISFMPSNNELSLTKTPPGIMHNTITFDVTQQNPDFSGDFNKYNYDKENTYKGRLVFSDKTEFNFEFIFTGTMIENTVTSYQGCELKIITYGGFSYAAQS